MCLIKWIRVVYPVVDAPQRARELKWVLEVAVQLITSADI